MSRSSELTYTPAWWVRGPHLQTLWGKFRRRPPVVTRAERWETPDGDEIEIHRVDARDPRAPRLLVLHGLEGTIRSHYLLGFLHVAQTLGWAADAMIFRGCDGRMNRARRMYHSGETTDIDFVARRLISENPDQPLFVVGFSLGGNVLLKWLGELGNNYPEQLVAAAAVSVPYDLEKGSRHIERGFSRIYTWHFLKSLKRKALAKLKTHPESFDAGRLEGVKTLYDFDNFVTAPLHGFEDAHDYYSRSSSRHYLSKIQVKTLLLSSSDDPFLPPEVLDDVFSVARRNHYLTVEAQKCGGHVGFVGGLNPLRPVYYAEHRVFEFFRRSFSPV